MGMRSDCEFEAEELFFFFFFLSFETFFIFFFYKVVSCLYARFEHKSISVSFVKLNGIFFFLLKCEFENLLLLSCQRGLFPGSVTSSCQN